MANLTNTNVKIQYLIKQRTPQGEFNDAIYFTKTEFDALPESALVSLVNKRVTNWIAFATEQRTKVAVPPTQEELLIRKQALEDELISLNLEIN